MSIDSEKGARRVFVCCDDCGAKTEEIAAEGETFSHIWTRLKEEGWRSKAASVDGAKKPVWVHYCPACVRAFAADQKSARSDQRRLV